MSEDPISYLDKFYQRLYSVIIGKKKRIEKSLLFNLINVKSNDRYRLLLEGAMNSLLIPKHALTYLITNDFIRETESLNTYMITAKGIWEIENKQGILNNDSVVNYLDEKFLNFQKEAEKPLSEKQKVIVLSMIAARAFSEKSSFDLHKSEKTLDAIKEITDGSYGLLKTLGQVKKLDQKELYWKKGKELLEHPVSNIYRHTDAIAKQTKGLFVAAKSQRYYLDLIEDARISKNRFGYILKKIFNNQKLTPFEVDQIYDFCCDMSHKKSIYLFNLENHKFDKPKYDEMIRDSLDFLEY